MATLVVGHFLEWLLVDLGGCDAVYVVTRQECFDHILVIAQVGYETQLYL